MKVIRSLDGQNIDVDENAIMLVAGPFPHDVGRVCTSSALESTHRLMNVNLLRSCVRPVVPLQKRPVIRRAGTLTKLATATSDPKIEIVSSGVVTTT